MSKLRIYEAPEQVAAAFAQQLFQLVSDSSAGEFHWVLSGGSTPKMLFELLARDYTPLMQWSKIHFWWGDERCVPPWDDENNYKMAYDHLLGRIPVSPEQIHRIKGELAPGEACRQYIDEIQSHLKIKQTLPAFDLIMLGIGDDGHTASIFPDQMDLMMTKTLCKVAAHPVTGQKRVSLTGPVLNNARQVSFLVTGKSKALRVAQILNKENTAAALPAYHIQPIQGGLTFFLDREAASGING